MRNGGIGLVLFTVLLVGGCGEGERGGGGLIELSFGHVGEPGSLFAVSAEEFARRANVELAGRVQVNVFGSSQLGGDELMLQKLKLGTLDFALPSTIMSSTVDAFGLPGDKPPAGHQAWPDFDRDILGANDSSRPDLDPGITVTTSPGAGDRQLLRGVDVRAITGTNSFFTVQPLADSATAILQGAIAGKKPQPVAWTNTNVHGGRVFYTSLGHHDNFRQTPFERLLLNAIQWALDQSSP